jgi:hypothetical protein
VKGADRFARKLRRDIPEAVRKATRDALAKQAERISGAQKALAPEWLRPKIGWRHGGRQTGDMFAPRGPQDAGAEVATLFAQDPKAGWFEFGTAERFHKSGKSVGRITARPYFFPAFRLHRKAAGRAIRAALRKAIRNGAKK